MLLTKLFSLSNSGIRTFYNLKFKGKAFGGITDGLEVILSDRGNKMSNRESSLNRS